MRTKSAWPLLVLAGLLSTMTMTGCFQTTVSGQTLPSAYYLDDDVQYFPMGPEQKLANQIRSLERYKAERQAQEQGLNENVGN